jgi:hypothetical protein
MSLEVHVFVDQGRQPTHIFRCDLQAFGPQLVGSRFHINGVPQHNRIDHKPKRPELIFLSLPVALSNGGDEQTAGVACSRNAPA